MSRPRSWYPLFVDLTDRLCVVVGGGTVGLRKGAALRAAGARVRLVCLEARPETPEWQEVDWRREAYRPEHLDGAMLVVAAATPELNQRIVADAQQRGTWVNAADAPAAGTVYLPAVVRRGGFVLAVGTGGAAPALARQVRQRLEADYDEAFGRWVALLAELRPLVQQRVTDSRRRRALWEKLCAWHWLDRLRQADDNQIRADMGAEIETEASNSERSENPDAS
ncbi:MAG: bifunctional precorrin-2 dehydrogenase/sirohydrochlorin ferrochelatase [Gemmataceae bacterium]